VRALPLLATAAVLYVELRTVLEAVSQGSFTPNVEEIDRARAQEYALLATLLSRSPDSVLLSRLADLRDDTSPIGVAHGAVREAAVRVNEERAAREYFALFAGLREGSLLPYSSHYLAETLYGRPLARLREAFQGFGIEIAPERSEPEDHAAFLCEVMAGLADFSIPAPAGAEREFFQEHLLPWIRRFFSTSSTLRRPIFTQLLVCSGEPLWISRLRPFLARPKHGVLSVEWNLVASNSVTELRGLGTEDARFCRRLLDRRRYRLGSRCHP
jgi:TorA maturation chaperone TorD